MGFEHLLRSLRHRLLHAEPMAGREHAQPVNAAGTVSWQSFNWECQSYQTQTARRRGASSSMIFTMTPLTRLQRAAGVLRYHLPPCQTAVLQSPARGQHRGAAARRPRRGEMDRGSHPGPTDPQQRSEDSRQGFNHGAPGLDRLQSAQTAPPGRAHGSPAASLGSPAAGPLRVPGGCGSGHSLLRAAAALPPSAQAPAAAVAVPSALPRSPQPRSPL